MRNSRCLLSRSTRSHRHYLCHSICLCLVRMSYFIILKLSLFCKLCVIRPLTSMKTQYALVDGNYMDTAMEIVVWRDLHVHPSIVCHVEALSCQCPWSTKSGHVDRKLFWGTYKILLVHFYRWLDRCARPFFWTIIKIDHCTFWLLGYSVRAYEHSNSR